MASIIKVDTIQTAAGGTPSVADLGVTIPASSLPSGSVLQTQYSSRVGRTDLNSTSYVEPSTSLRVTITPKSSTSTMHITYLLYMEADGVAWGLFSLEFSTDSGSTWTEYRNGHITSALDNASAQSLIETHTHGQSTSTEIIYRFKYRLTDAGQGHSIADNGPGESPQAYCFVQEIAG